MAEPIPAPRPLPILGNALDLDAEFPMTSLMNLSAQYGEIFKLTLGGHDRVFVCSQQLVNEMCDEKRFQKAVTGALLQIRGAVHDGLFTAFPGEHNWEVAHRALMPAFGPMPISNMFDEMYDIATQLVLKWARYGPEHAIHVTDDFTRLTLDSIALCAMGTRFNSFYTEDLHPFVKAMVGLLVAAGERARRPAFADFLYRSANQKYHDDISLLAKIASDVVEERRKNPIDKADLLNAMILNKDPKTGEHLSEDSIVNNMITFLIAGHETTSGLLSFLFYELLKNPQAYRRAQDEVDEIVGKGSITAKHLSKLRYINACLRETLRLHPTAPAFTVSPKQDEIIGGKYLLPKDTPVVCFVMAAHRDPAVYGEDAEAFKPERMLDEPYSELPPNSWKPFGNGSRACIGRPFAWQESLLAVAMLFQNFDLSLADPAYQLQIQSTLTIKPKGFYMRAKVRHPDFEASLNGKLNQPSESGTPKARQSNEPDHPVQATKPLLSIFYGSNTGTCESMAASLAASASSHGFVPKVQILDEAIGVLPRDGPVVIVTSSYEGEPPDNAVHFVSWLKSLQELPLTGLKYAVFGCGNRDWQHTYQKIPTLIDDLLMQRGGERVVERGAADANDGALFDTYDTWQDEKLWPAIAKAFESKANNKADSHEGLDIEVSAQTRPSLLRQDLQQALVLDTKLLTAPGAPQRRHMEIQLPSGMSYKAGDYLAVLPWNPLRNVRRAMSRFHLPWDATIKISGESHTALPTERATSLFEVLSALVELSQPATSKQVKKVAESVPEEDSKAQLQKLSDGDYKQEVLEKNTSLLDILEMYPTAQFSLGQFLEALPPMRIRQYSISSSPLQDSSKCSITYTVLDAPRRGQDPDHGRFLGVSSNYLRAREPGDWIHVAVRPSHSGFHLPANDSTPVLMICAGTGLAPFRAFVQERALKIESRRKLAPALLFYGCGSPAADDLYADEFARWEELGAVEVRRAYSRDTDKTFGCRHVQDRVWHDREDAKKLFVQNAQVYMCGAGVVGAELDDVMKKIYIEAKGASEEDAIEWVSKMKGTRYWADVFA
ncbi:hypothetical protein PV05_00925 [Exophiala xenobiotica]|uniref:Bifunctional cytochrome P450/NADPH--P450 reductase n=1 Tax=Exophiala xenobiotica TaxID=348802 RepID=A0A0D2C734_9EURO|nr:uncharacterized protein PV05_00925 [Exophiala xenobiotica]KIW60731.1 hypothetical protein PV05_00925 [Exophiala xenobiotica]